jgi:hypothetical protein
MVEAQLALQIFVHPLGPVAFLDQADELLLADGLREGGEPELRGGGFVVTRSRGA